MASVQRDAATDEEFLAQLYKGGELLAAGKVSDAKDHLERAYQLHPKNEKAQNLLGLSYFKLGLFERASEIYELLVNDNPVDPTLRVNLGLVYLKTNALPRAIREFETATDLQPDHKKAHNYLGLALAQAGDYARAREHFVIAGSDAMAEKMGRAMASSAETPPMTVTLGGAPPEPPPSAPPRSEETQIEVMSEEELPPAVESEPAVPKSDSAALVSEARSFGFGGSDGPPLPQAGYEVRPGDGDGSSLVHSDWGGQINREAELPSVVVAPELADEMRFAEDEGPPALHGSAEPVAAPARDLGLEATPEAMPLIEAVVEEVQVDVVSPDPVAAGEDVSGSGWSDVPAQPDAWAQPPADDASMGISATSEAWSSQQQTQWSAGDETVATGWSGDATEVPAVDLAPASVLEAAAETYGEPLASAEGGSAVEPVAANDDAWAQPVAEVEPPPSAPEPMAVEMAEASVSPVPTDEVVESPTAPQPAYPAWLAPPPADSMPTVPVVAAAEPLPPPERAEAPAGYSSLAVPKLAELGPQLDTSVVPTGGPFHLGNDGLAVTVAGEMLMRLENVVAVVGTVDAVPERRRMRGRSIDAPFGEGPHQLQRVKGHGVLHLEAGKGGFQALELADDGAYVREERVFAFEESVAFENGRLTGEGSLALDLVHLRGQGRVLLKLDAGLKAMAIPPGTPLKVPLARLVGWYGRVTPRLLGFFGQGAVELTGEGYALIAAAS